MLAAQPLSTFCEATATAEPTPGGGAVAAAVGALGAAVGAMAGRFSEGRAEAAGAEQALATEIGALDELRRRLLVLLDDDVQAYTAVRAAYALPRDDADAKAGRKAAIQDALAAAAEPPLAVCRACLDGLRQLSALAEHANPHLLSDLGVAACTLGAAQRAAWFNVLVNAGLLERPEVADRLRAEGRELLREGGRHAAALERRVLAALDA